MSYRTANARRYRPAAGVVATYIGRPQRGQPWHPLANPFIPPGVDQHTRFTIIGRRMLDPLWYPPEPDTDTVYLVADPLAEYRRWLWRWLNNGQAGDLVPQAIASLAAAHDGVLLCWCAPNPCHADIVVRAIDWYRHRYQLDIR